MSTTLKRARAASGSSGGRQHAAAEGKEEPPRKVKKDKSVQHVSTAAATATPVPPPPTPSVAILGGLSLFGEQLPRDGYDEVPLVAENTCSELKHVLSKVCELKGSSSAKALSDVEVQKRKGVMLFSNLKKLNRLSHLYCKDVRDKTHEQKLDVDSLYLQLQNLKYEAMHLRREITSCLEFESLHEDIELVVEEEFYSAAPENISMPDVTHKDDHQLMLSRLEWELEQRKQLYKQQEGLEAVLNQQQSEISQTSDSLSRLGPVLEGIRKATLPLQEALNVPLDRHREENHTAQLLPAPLYVGFMQARAYSEVEDPSLSVSIAGDAGEAKAAAQATPLERSDEDSGDSDAEGGGAKERRKKRRKRGRSSREKKDISKCFPLTVNLVLMLKELASVEVVLSYLPHFSAVCAGVSSLSIESLTEAQLSAHLDKSALLHCLFDTDTGRTSPSSAVTSHIRRLGGDVFSLAVRQHGFPYKWVQRVCGVDTAAQGGGEGGEGGESGVAPREEVSADSIGAVVAALKERLTAQVYLLKQLIALDECKFLLKSCDEAELFSAEPGSQFVRWKPLSLAEAQAIQIACLPVFNTQERTNRFFLAQFQHKQGAKLHCLVCVGGEFPSSVPTIAVMVEWASGQREAHNLQIKNLEVDVNLDFPQRLSCDPAGQYLLCRQLRRLQDTFDAYLELKASSERTTHKHRALFRIRGRGRLLSLQD